MINQTKRIIRRQTVENLSSLKDPQLWRLEQQQYFPKRFKLVPGGRTVGWYEEDVLKWLENPLDWEPANA